ncbi:hypothetical protein P7C70_g8689, partial [Phenoliferia sp. Uapishka_3]
MMSSFDSDRSLPNRGIGAITPNGLVKAEVESRKISRAPWEEEEEEVEGYQTVEAERMVEAMETGDNEGFEKPEEKEKRKRILQSLVGAGVANEKSNAPATTRPMSFGLGLANWRERAINTKRRNYSPIGGDEPEDLFNLIPVNLNVLPPTRSEMAMLEIPTPSPTFSNRSNESGGRPSADFSDVSGASEYESARADTPVLSFTSTPSEHEDSDDVEVETPQEPRGLGLPLLAFTKQQTSLWVLDTIASVSGGDEGGTPLSVIGEESEGGEPDTDGSPAFMISPPQVFPGPPISPRLPSEIQESRRNSKKLTIKPVLAGARSTGTTTPSPTASSPRSPITPITPTYASSYNPSHPSSITSSSTVSKSHLSPASSHSRRNQSASPSPSRSKLGRLTVLFRKPATVHLGISSESLGLHREGDEKAPSIVVDDDDSMRSRETSASWGTVSRGGETDDSGEGVPSGFSRRDASGADERDKFVMPSTPEVKQLVGLLERFEREEKERLRSISTRRTAVA